MFNSHRPFECQPQPDEPLEREYEGWITRGMEDYFRELGFDLQCVAAGRLRESESGIDEFCSLPGKYFGLQFKRPRRRSNESVEWDLASYQTGLIMAQPQMWYALPVVLNRNLRRVSLHHVLFWRPDVKDGERIYSTSSGAVYVHSKAEGNDAFNSNLSPRVQRPLLGEQSRDYDVSHAYRWGRFSEGLLQCSVGAVNPSRLDPALSRAAQIARARKFLRETMLFLNELPEDQTVTVCRLVDAS